MTHTKTDVAIIGAGPVGLFAVFECGMLGLKSHVFDALEEIGGQCTALYPEKPIYDIPGLPEIAAGGLIENLEKQAAAFNPVYHLGSPVEGLQEKDGRFILKTARGNTVDAGAVIIEAGAGAVGPNRPPIENIKDFEGTSVFYACRNKSQFKDCDVAIAGGGDSALDWAIALQPIAKSITIIHRRDKFRGAPDSVSKLQDLREKGLVKIETPYQLKDIRGSEGRIDHIDLADMDGNQKQIKADALLCFFGLSTSLGAISHWELELSKKELAVNPETCQTNRDGVYAIGDVATYPKKLKLILTGFAEAAQAAHDIYHRLNPDTPLHFEYSTTKGVPGSPA